jgi:CspA family cold shock protein
VSYDHDSNVAGARVPVEVVGIILVEECSSMASGTIKKLVNDKGFGFIQTDNGADIFFHHSTVQNGAFDNLTEGQHVEYTVEQGGGQKGKGPRAASVTPV